MKDNPKLIVKDTHKYGKGVFAKENIKKGELIFDWRGGPIYTAEKCSDLPNPARNHAIEFAKNKWIDTKEIGYYLNHSCNPNCGVKELFKIVAMRNIKKGEEVTFDYDMTDNSDWKMKCKCGSKNCRKIIRGYRFLPQDFRKKYKGYISEWLLRRKK